MLDQPQVNTPIAPNPILEGYQNLIQIGEGGYGRIYQAIQASTGQRVAVKMLKLDSDLDETRHKYQVARFERETHLCAELNHPNIVSLLDKGYDPKGVPFAVFEFIEGETLKDLIVRSGGLSAEATGALMGQVLDALAAAHAKGIVHRDLKPHNIMVHQTGSALHVKVLDFGIGAFTREFRTNDYQSLTLTREVMGTPAYSAPEQLRGEPATIKSDLYAWGLVVIECLTGLPVMKEDSIAQVFQQQLNAENVPLPPALAGHSLAELLRRVLHKNARLRTEDTHDLYQDFQKINFNTLVGEIGKSLTPAPVSGPDAVTAANPLAWKDLRSEKRQITVLGMKLSLDSREAEGLNMEALEAIQQDQLNQVKDTAARFGAHIAASVTDNLVFYFGYPNVSDNDARRAGRVALEVVSQVRRRSALLHATHGIKLEVRISLHSGTVLHNPHQAPAGLIPKTAFDMLYRTAAGSILASNDAKKLLDPYLEFESHQAVSLPGLSTELATWQILGERQTEALSFLRPWSANREMIGRDPERETLQVLWKSVQEGSGKAAVVHGQAGIGKSKMIYELKKQVRSDGFIFRECRCLPEYQNNGLFPFLDMLRNHWGIAGVQNNAAVFAILERELGAAGVDLTLELPILCFWLSIPVQEGYQLSQATPDVQKQMLFSLLGKSLLHIGRENPFLLVLEDLHWLDPTGQEFVEFLLKNLENQSFLFLMTTRPVFIPTWEYSSLSYQELLPLEEENIKTLINSVLDGEGIDEKALAYIEQRADGIPLYLEELTRMLVEEGYLVLQEGLYQFDEETDIQAIPSTLQDLLNARLDRLGFAKESAQIAATIGREFNYELLVRASLRDEASIQTDLNALMDADLIYRQRKVNGDGYIFRHALIRDAAYEGMLAHPRQEHHLRIAETLKTSFPETMDENPFEVARHLAAGKSYLEASGFGTQAVEKEVAKSSNFEANSMGNMVREWIKQIDSEVRKKESILTLNFVNTPALMATHGYGSKEVIALNEQNEELLEELEQLPHSLQSKEVRKLIHQANWAKFNGFHHSGQRKKAWAAAKKILRGFQTGSDHKLKSSSNGDNDPGLENNIELEIGTLSMIGQARHADGKLHEAEALYDRVIELCDTIDGDSLGNEMALDPKSGAWAFKILTRLSLGFPEEALRLGDQSIQAAEEKGHFLSTVLAYILKALTGHHLRAPEITSSTMEEFMTKYKGRYEEMWLARHLNLLKGWAEQDRGILPILYTLAEEGQDYAISWYKSLGADLLLLDRKEKEAISLLKQTLQNSIEGKDWWTRPMIKRYLAMAHYQRRKKPTPRIKKLLKGAIKDARKMDMHWHEMEALTNYIKIAAPDKEKAKMIKRLKTVLLMIREGQRFPAYQEAAQLLNIPLSKLP